MRYLSIVLVLAGCGDNLTDTGGAHGGSRLQLINYVYADGAREWDREVFYDAELGERCRPVQFSDGSRYCMPEAAAGKTVFVDARCTRSLGLDTTGNPAPPYFIRSFALHGEEHPSRLYVSGDRAVAPTQIWQQLDGFCLGPVAPPAGWYYELGTELGPEALVRVRQSALLEGDRLGVGIDTTVDGLHVPGVLYDRRITRACTIQPRANSDAAECVPDALPRASYYADEQCTQPVLAMPTGQSADFATHYVSRTTCWSLRRVGELLTTPKLYEQLGDACISTSTPGGFVFFATGVELSVASAARVVATAPGQRLAPIELVHGPLRVPAGFMFDRELGGECQRDPRLARLGEHVCVPHATVVAQTVFADALCATRLQLAFVRAGTCDPAPLFASDGDARHAIGAPYTQPFFELEPGDACGTFQAPPGYVAHALGPALPPETFARATVELD